MTTTYLASDSEMPAADAIRLAAARTGNSPATVLVAYRYAVQTGQSVQVANLLVRWTDGTPTDGGITFEEIEADPLATLQQQ